MPPHNMAMTLIGAAMLWFGWFGFNAGSALAADAAAGMAMAVTQVSAVFGAAGWLACEKIAGHKPSALGLASGAVSGLVGITPAAGFTGPSGAAAIGILTAAACFVSVTVVKHKLRYDDSLDAFGIHGFGGLVGGILTGIFFRQPHFRRGCGSLAAVVDTGKRRVRYGGIQRADELGDFEGRGENLRRPARRQGCRTRRFGSEYPRRTRGIRAAMPSEA